MHDGKQSSRSLWVSLGAGTCLVALSLAAACSNDTRSEIDSYDSAVTTQKVEGARTFLSAFRTSHLAGDLIESLPPGIALQVCADLPTGVSRSAVRSCKQLREAVAAQPASALIQTAAMPAAAVSVSVANSRCGEVANLVPVSDEAKADIKPGATKTAGSTKDRQVRKVQVAAVVAGDRTVPFGTITAGADRGGNGGDGHRN